ncbi:MAG: HlyC/CorC family transporter [Chloroflexota bacterium]|nr:MAG: HlyC/CorC family transporter [Chloroflexota bacterium]
MGETLPLGSSDVFLSIVVVAVCLFFVAFFSSSEASLISVSKIRILHLAEQANKAAQAIQRMVAKHDNFFATILLTENLFIVFASSLGTALALSIIGERGVIFAPLVMTILIVLVGEITPKTLAARHAERYALLVARPMELIMRMLSPIIFVFTLSPKLIMRLIGDRGEARSPFITEAELRMLINIGEEEGTVEEVERELLENVFQFGDRLVREVMVPRPEIVGIETNANLDSFLQVFSHSSRARFPVYEDSLDNVVGILSIKDVLAALVNNSIDKRHPIASWVRPAHFVPETKRIGVLLGEMQARKIQMAIAVDEFGGTAGLVTLQQLVEEIVGSMGDELEEDEEDVKAIDERTVEVDAGMRVDEFNDELDAQLPDGDYETLAGFMLSNLGHIPREGEHVRHGKLRISIAEMKGLKIEKLRVVTHEGGEL